MATLRNLTSMYILSSVYVSKLNFQKMQSAQIYARYRKFNFVLLDIGQAIENSFMQLLIARNIPGPKLSHDSRLLILIPM